MSDDEIIELCAESMGWKHLGAIGVELVESERRASIADKLYPGRLWCLSGSNDWWTDPEGGSVCGPCQGIPNPLEDDAACFALIKKHELSFGFSNGWGSIKGDPEGKLVAGSYHYPSLNRAVCLTVANMQKHKAK